MITSTRTPGRNGGRGSARRLMVAVVASLCASLPGAQPAAAADPAPQAGVTVSEQRGVYTVSARFDVPEQPAVVLAVLSDYERIPRFMPDVRRSVIVERSPGRLVVEQEAVSQFMMFSKKVHLLLDVTETSDALRFTDRCGKSFASYQGAWRAVAENGRTIVTYELSARPGFEVPEFILKRLLKRDSGQMIARLRDEFRARAVTVER